MFTKTAKHYDAVYADKNYEDESELITSLISERVPDAKTLLDVACGTGKHLEHMQQTFECTGVELDPEMLSIAKDRVPSLPLHVGDMCEFDLGRKFDAVTCLFSSIGYTKTVGRMEQAVANMAKHLNPDGTLIITTPNPFYSKQTWKIWRYNEPSVHEEHTCWFDPITLSTL